MDEKLEEGENAAGGCDVQQGMVTTKLESNQELVAAMDKCEITLEFKSQGISSHKYESEIHFQLQIETLQTG